MNKKGIKMIIRFSIIFFLLLEINLCKATDFEKNIEVGIVLVLPKNVIQETKNIEDKCFENFKKNGFKIENKVNIPHISLFQMNIEISSISEIKKHLKYISNSYNSPSIILDNYLTDTQENIFWNASDSKNDKLITEMHKEVVEGLRKYISLIPMAQVLNNKDLSSKQKEMIKNYGIFWGLPGKTFNPHITIVYGSGKDQADVDGNNKSISSIISSIKFPNKFSFYSEGLGLAKLGYLGNVEEIIEVFYFQDR